MSQDILAWHGAPNLAAICLLGLVLGYLAMLVKDGLDPPRWAASR